MRMCCYWKVIENVNTGKIKTIKFSIKNKGFFHVFFLTIELKMRQLQTMGHKQHHTWMLFISLSLFTIGGVAALFTLKLTHWVYSWPFTLQHFPLKWSTSLKCITARMSALSELCLRLQPLKMHKKSPQPSTYCTAIVQDEATDRHFRFRINTWKHTIKFIAHLVT